MFLGPICAVTVKFKFAFSPFHFQKACVVLRFAGVMFDALRRLAMCDILLGKRGDMFNEKT